MNYQKLFSRFYNSAGDQQNNPDLTAEEGKSYIVNEEINVEYSYPGQNNDEETLMCEIESANVNWELSAREQVPVPVEPITAEQVRWFYKAIDDKTWSEFNGYDSLLIENKYRELKTTTTNSTDEKSEINDDVVEIDRIVPKDSTTCQHTRIKLDLVKSNIVDKKDERLQNLPMDKSHPEKKLHNNIECNVTIDNDNNMDNIIKIESESNTCDNQSLDSVNTIIVRGGMYEANLQSMTCVSIYWPGEQCVITRGIYFYDGSWQPIEGCYGEVIEEEHLKLYGHVNKNNLEASPSQPGVAVHSHHFPEFHVEWLSSLEVYLYWGGASRQLVRSVTQKFGFYQSTGYRLRRGYKSKASISERPPDITQVVFVIHGIGQKMDSNRIIRNTNALRTNCDWLRGQYANCGGTDEKGRAELFPARWRAGERGSAAALLEAAAPAGAPSLRRAINDAAMDVMYYTSPVYGKQVQDDLTQELNRLYTMFMARNPNYKGQFSAVAHSLGCVILYDIITGHKIGCERCISRDGEAAQNKEIGLLFQLQKVFCLGSPLGVFLALRQANSSSAQVLPTGFKTRLYNVFYLSDPVAYRLEPLIAKWLSEYPPIVIPPHYAAPLTSPSSQNSPAKGPWKIWSYVKHPWQKTETGSPIPSQSIPNTSDDGATMKSKYEVTMKKSNIESNSEQCDIHMKNENEIDFDIESDMYMKDSPRNIGNLEKHNDDLKDEKPPLEQVDEHNPRDVLPYRIDYTLKDSGITNKYIWAITSHTSYWNNYDVAYFVLSRLFSEEDNDDEEFQVVKDILS